MTGVDGAWLRLPKRETFHFRADEAETFICGERVPNSIRRATMDDFASYSAKCETCLLRFYEAEEALRCT